MCVSGQISTFWIQRKWQVGRAEGSQLLCFQDFASKSNGLKILRTSFKWELLFSRFCEEGGEGGDTPVASGSWPVAGKLLSSPVFLIPNCGPPPPVGVEPRASHQKPISSRHERSRCA